ncbi:DUF389 domain-containing protein [Candidatus Saccharibacteria bacterium]|nr:DUF389 domain-containing protein [Candidatus Saccharibacteria bacterium]
MKATLIRIKRSIRQYLTIPVETSTLKKKTVRRLNFTFEYILLLAGSVVISTLGLLMDSSAAIIGGMIISPLIIPILSLSYGIYDGNIRIMHRSLVMIFVSVAITLGISVLITELSPLKNITDEISIRTTPTLLDLFIALSAGIIGILALSRHKIAESFAGVAIATSIVPPLSVAGIGISFGESSIFYGGMLLFMLNILAITFVGTIYLTLQHWLATDKTHISIRALSIIGGSLLLIMLPLAYQLRSYTYNLTVQKESREAIETVLSGYHPNSRIDHIDTAVGEKNNQKIISINAKITIDESDSVSYELENQINKHLRNTLNTNVQLKLSIQRSVGIISEEQSRKTIATRNFTEAFSEKMVEYHPKVTISSITLDNTEEDEGLIAVIKLTGEIKDTPSKKSLEKIQAEVSDFLPENARYDITYTPVIQISSPNAAKSTKK